MNIEQLRHSLKEKWLTYYCDNREWLVQLSVWVVCDGKHRPSASFILATLTALEPQLIQLMPLLSGLNSSPDRIVSALGLNFNPDDMAEQWLREQQKATQTVLLPSSSETLGIAFHPEAVLVHPSVTLDSQSPQKPSPSLNGHHATPALPTIRSSHGGPHPEENSYPDPQVIARQDEQCVGRDRTHPDHPWR